MNQLEITVEKLKASVENAESLQQVKLSCLWVSGVQENIEISTDDYICTLAKTIDVDIDSIHWKGKPALTREHGAKPRDTVLKYISYGKRAQFYKARARVLTKSRGYMGVYLSTNISPKLKRSFCTELDVVLKQTDKK